MQRVLSTKLTEQLIHKVKQLFADYLTGFVHFVAISSKRLLDRKRLVWFAKKADISLQMTTNRYSIKICPQQCLGCLKKSAGSRTTGQLWENVHTDTHRREN